MIYRCEGCDREFYLETADAFGMLLEKDRETKDGLCPVCALATIKAMWDSTGFATNPKIVDGRSGS